MGRYGLHDSLGYWVNRLARRMHEAFDEEAAPLGASAAQWAVLVTLLRGAGDSPAALARHIGVHPAAITRLLDTLEEHGHLVRTAHENDRRSTVLSLTPAGKELARELVRVSRRTNARFTKHLTPREREAVTAAIRKMVE